MFRFKAVYPLLGLIMVGVSILHSNAELITTFYGFSTLILKYSEETDDLTIFLKKIIHSQANWNEKQSQGKLVVGAQEAYKQCQKLRKKVL